jgi:hypothetical protein
MAFEQSVENFVLSSTAGELPLEAAGVFEKVKSVE